MTLTSRYPNWIYEALKLQEAKIPIDLDSQIIQATIDTYQNGWALAEFKHFKATRSMQFLNEVALVPPRDFLTPTPEPIYKILLCASITASIGGTGPQVQILMRNDPPTVGESRTSVMRDFQLVNGVQDWIDDIAKDGNYKWVAPPDWYFSLVVPGTGVPDDSFVMESMWAQIPSGFNVGI